MNSRMDSRMYSRKYSKSKKSKKKSKKDSVKLQLRWLYTIKKDYYKEVYKAILIDSTYLSHFMRWKLHGGRHQVVQKHTAFPKSHQTISWSQTFPNLNENLKLYRTLSRRFWCSATATEFEFWFRFTRTQTYILETVAYRAPRPSPIPCVHHWYHTHSPLSPCPP